MSGFLTAENVVDVKNVITVLIVVAIILHTFARLRQNTARIPRGLVVETRIADAVGRGKMGRQRLKGLSSAR